MRISVNTRLFALLGDPVSHSLSPRMQNAGFLEYKIPSPFEQPRARATAPTTPAKLRQDPA